MTDTRDRLRRLALDEAMQWRGTPYRHKASNRDPGADRDWGADFYGLLRGIWRALYGVELEAHDYAPDWAAPGEEELLAILRRNMVEIPLADAREGDVVTFRMAAGVPVRHLAILSADPCERHKERRMVHAYWGRAVVESWMGQWWETRLAFAFTWPEEVRS